MKILDRYLSRSLLLPLVAASGAFLTFAIVVDLFERLDKFIDNQVPPLTILHYYVASVPFLFILTLPVATLIGVLFSLGGMARRNELIAMTTNGISLYRILRPVLLVGLLLSLFAIAFTVDLVPRGNRTSNDIYDHEIRGRPRVSGVTRRNLHFLGQGGRLFLIGKYDGGKGAMEDVVVQQFAAGTLVHRVDAKTASWDDETWSFQNGYLRRFTGDGIVTAEEFGERSFPEIRETPADFLRVTREPDEMTYGELRDHRRRTGLSGGDITRLLVDEHTRVSFPFASLIVVLLGAPLAGAIRRGGHALGIGLALLVGFVYYVILQIGQTLGYNSTLPPLVAAWLPNLFFLGFGGIALAKTRK